MRVKWALLLGPAAAYAAALGVVAVHAARSRRRPTPRSAALPRVAVVVAARNEEAALPRCLDALTAQDYPPDHLTIYVADDHSTDGTAAVIDRYRQRHGGPAVRYVAVSEPHGRLRGKALAVHTAIARSDEPVILVTDADCAPPPTWARSLTAYLEAPEVGVVCGITEVETDPPVSPDAPVPSRRLAELQALDWTFLLTVCSFFVEIGRPVTAMGNNMGLRREAYDAVGGYPALPFSVTEDYLLFKTIVEKTSWRARFPADPSARNVTLPLDRLREVYEQRRRWARGGLRARPWVYAAYAGFYGIHLAPFAGLAVAPRPALGALALKAGAEYAVIRAALGTERRRLLRRFPLWALYLPAYIVTLPVALLISPRIRWKGRRV